MNFVIQKKICRKCKEEKPIWEYYPGARGRYDCKRCVMDKRNESCEFYKISQKTKQKCKFQYDERNKTNRKRKERKPNNYIEDLK